MYTWYFTDKCMHHPYIQIKMYTWYCRDKCTHHSIRQIEMYTWYCTDKCKHHLYRQIEMFTWCCTDTCTHQLYRQITHGILYIDTVLHKLFDAWSCTLECTRWSVHLNIQAILFNVFGDIDGDVVLGTLIILTYYKH